MKEHECVIGLLHYSTGYSALITLADLIEHIQDTELFNTTIKEDPVLCKAKELYKKEWTLKDYADKRKSTNLYQFDFCPKCGKKINWKKIKELPHEEI